VHRLASQTLEVGLVRDAIYALAVDDGAWQSFHLPAAETYVGWLNDVESFALKQEHLSHKSTHKLFQFFAWI
jgi:hypothetical protein